MEENQFDRLPDSLLLVIFNKILKARTLIQCSLVSKRFASLIAQTDTLFLQVTFCDNDSVGCGSGWTAIFKNLIAIFKFWRRAQNSCCSNHAAADVISNLMKNKFPKVRFLQMELHLGCINKIMKGLPLKIKYKAVFESHLEIFVILSAKSIRKTTAAIATPTDESLEQALRIAQECQIIFLKYAAFWHSFYLTQVFNQVTHHQSVVLYDDMGMGNVCMGKEQLARLRSCTTPFRYSEFKEVLWSEKLWYVPVLNLPLSGYVIEEVSLAVVKPADQPIVMERDVQLIVGAFDEEEEGKVYDEAVMEILNDNSKKTCMREIR